MKHLLLLLILLPAATFAQPQVQITGGLSLSFLPSTETGRAAEDALSSGIFLGGEVWLPGKNDHALVGAFFRYGRVFSTRLQADFNGPGAGSTPGNERTIFAHSRLQRFDHLQLGLSAKVARFSAPDIDYSIQLGGGVNIIQNQQTHLAASEFHQGEERLQTPTSGYEIDKDGIRESATFVNSITLLDDMLLRASPFLEAGIHLDAREGTAGFISFQLGLTPIVDPDLYREAPQGRVWMQLQFGAKGRIF